MKKSILAAALVLILTLALTACSYGGNTISIHSQSVNGSGNISTEKRTLSDFDTVKLSSIGNLTIHQGNSNSLTIKADENLLPYITSDVLGNTLEIGMKPNINVNPTQAIEYTLTVKSLSGIVLSGFGNITADEMNGKNIDLTVGGSGDIQVGRVTADAMNVHLTGFGNITVSEAQVDAADLTLTGSGNLKIPQLKTENLDLTLSGFGTANLSGEATNQGVRLTGSGSYQGGDLKGSTGNVTISGLGDATLWIEDSLVLSLTGSGNVKYYGEPKITQTITGLGSVKSLGSHE